VTGFWIIIRRDLTLTFRQGGGLGPATGFILAVIVLIPLALGPDQVLLRLLAPGMMWLSLLLAVLLTADRIFNQDFDDGSLELLTMTPLSLAAVSFAKSLAHWLGVSLPLAVITPVLAFMLNLDPALFFTLLASTVLGSLALSMLAGIGGALTAGLKRGGLLISLLILPLYVPVMIFGISANSAALGPEGSVSSLLVLLAITMVTCVINPWACASALRTYLK
jgi:heme exporter protein B